jgi:hypothetical protein
VLYREPAAIDGQVSVGDRILEVNGIGLEGLPSDTAIQTLRDAVHDRRWLKSNIIQFQLQSYFRGICFVFLAC